MMCSMFEYLPFLHKKKTPGRSSKSDRLDAYKKKEVVLTESEKKLDAAIDRLNETVRFRRLTKSDSDK